MKYVFLFMAGALMLSCAYGDDCRSQFIQCVQKTGNPLSCQSNYKNCTVGASISDAPPSPEAQKSLHITPFLRQDSGMSMFSLQATNSGKRPIQLNRVMYSVRCADSSVEQVEFDLSGPLLPTKQPLRIGQPQAVCLSAGGAVAIADAQPRTAGVATLKSDLVYYLTCAQGGKQTLTFTKLKNNVYRWENSKHHHGTISAQGILDANFIELACKPYDTPTTSLVHKAIQGLKSYLFDSSKNLPSDSDTKNAGPGTRG